jgi:ubiquinol-cytochrome c reductase cytochrome c subunit
VTLALLVSLLLAAIANPPASYGKQLYVTYCASCHGADVRGSDRGPSLVNAGMASLDFFLTTGRMPAAVPWLQVGHRGAQLNPGDIAAIEAYLAPVVGAPSIPTVTTAGDPRRGRTLYETNCEHCHGIKGEGGALGELSWIPGLDKASVTQIAEAVRSGPGQMPRFGEKQISQQDLVDIVTYVDRFEAEGQPPTAPPFRSTGPLPEGAVGWLGVIALVIYVFSAWRKETPPAERLAAVRPEVSADTGSGE